MDQLAWLRIVQSGPIGEARSCRFFWARERSVDSDGSDFLVSNIDAKT
ncbi:hypothetical protein [Novosphingobium sp.]